MYLANAKTPKLLKYDSYRLYAAFSYTKKLSGFFCGSYKTMEIYHTLLPLHIIINCLGPCSPIVDFV